GQETIFNNGEDISDAMGFLLSAEGQGCIRPSPWLSPDADGRFNVRSTDGEIACFGGRLPFYTFTGVYGLHYVMGTDIHLGLTYRSEERRVGETSKRGC